MMNAKTELTDEQRRVFHKTRDWAFRKRAQKNIRLCNAASVYVMPRSWRYSSIDIALRAAGLPWRREFVDHGAGI